ncbi:MAG: serine/threonine-protein kinase [Syntrophomonadaceae bacterium]
MIICPVCTSENDENKKFCGECGFNLGENATGRLSTDSLLESRYRIVKTIGRGGMGAVYLALDLRLNNMRVAIKEMSTNAIGPGNLQAAVAAFKKEAALLIALKHPALPRVIDFFYRGADRWYLVMDFIEGSNLAKILDDRGNITETEVLDWGRQLCEILDFLHRQKPPIIFRDLKPSNIMLTPEGKIKLVDFGIARHFQPGGSSDTVAYGSTGFAPPEQYGAGQTTVCSDIYALGATLHYLLTGLDPKNNPFVFDEPINHRNISNKLNAAIMMALDLKIANRPQSVRQWWEMATGKSWEKSLLTSEPALDSAPYFDDSGLVQNASDIDFEKKDASLTSLELLAAHNNVNTEQTAFLDDNSLSKSEEYKPASIKLKTPPNSRFAREETRVNNSEGEKAAYSHVKPIYEESTNRTVALEVHPNNHETPIRIDVAGKTQTLRNPEQSDKMKKSSINNTSSEAVSEIPGTPILEINKDHKNLPLKKKTEGNKPKASSQGNNKKSKTLIAGVILALGLGGYGINYSLTHEGGESPKALYSTEEGQTTSNTSVTPTEKLKTGAVASAEVQKSDGDKKPAGSNSNQGSESSSNNSEPNGSTEPETSDSNTAPQPGSDQNTTPQPGSGKPSGWGANPENNEHIPDGGVTVVNPDGSQPGVQIQ